MILQNTQFDNNNRHWFYNVLSVIIFVAVASFGFSIWQSGGAIFFDKHNTNQTAEADFSLFDFNGLIKPAYAQVCNLGSNPTAPASGGAIYYNSCDGKFRVYESGQWKPMSGFWTLHANGSSLYPTLTSYDLALGTSAAARSKLDVIGQTLIDTSSLVSAYGATSTRDALLLNTATNAENFAVINLLNMPTLAIYSSNIATWANFVAGKIYANNYYTCADVTDITTCGDIGGLTGDLWNYIDSSDTKSPIYNKNIADPSVPDGGGDVKITRSLYVDRSLQILGVNAGGSNDWVSDASLYPSNLNCPSQICRYNDLYITPSGSAKILTGQSGLVILSTAGEQWTNASPYGNTAGGSPIGDLTSVWAPSASTIYAVDSSKSLGLMKLEGGAWTHLTESQTVEDNISSYSKIWAAVSSDFPTRIFITGNQSIASALAYMEPSGNFERIFNVLQNSSLISGNKSGYIYVLSNSVSGDSQPDIAQLTQSLSGVVRNYFNTIKGASGYDIDPLAIAVDYSTSSCGSCVVIVGNHLTGSPTNILVGKGTNSLVDWKAPTLLVGGVTYNSSSYEFNDAWVGNTGTRIIISGQHRTTNARVVLISENSGANWRLDTPDLQGGVFVCSGGISACPNYLVSGGIEALYAAQITARIYVQGVSLIAGDIDVQANKWGGSAGGAASANPDDGYISTLTSSASSCPLGEFVVGLRLSGTGTVIGLYCQKL